MAADRPAGAAGTVVSIVGTRPEAIKLRPVARALAARGAAQQVILTGQHRGLDTAFDFLPGDTITPLDLDPTEQSAGEITETIHYRLCERLDRRDAALVLVQGDTSSAYAGALAAQDCAIAVGHVEAGLRTHDLSQPWPEEGHRVAIDALSDLRFAPSGRAAANLAAEADVLGDVHLTGNTAIDALLEVRGSPPPLPPAASGRRRLLLTCHRRENQGEPLRRIVRACRRIARELPVEIVLPLHPAPALRRRLVRLLGNTPHIRLIEPLTHAATVALMESSWAILTDSGGIQEEAPALGKPVLVLREVTERGEAIDSGNAELVGTDAARIFDAVARLVDDPARYTRMATPAFPFGDGKAAERIADVVVQFLARGMNRTP